MRGENKAPKEDGIIWVFVSWLVGKEVAYFVVQILFSRSLVFMYLVFAWKFLSIITWNLKVHFFSEFKNNRGA